MRWCRIDRFKVGCFPVLFCRGENVATRTWMRFVLLVLVLSLTFESFLPRGHVWPWTGLGAIGYKQINSVHSINQIFAKQAAQVCKTVSHSHRLSTGGRRGGAHYPCYYLALYRRRYLTDGGVCPGRRRATRLACLCMVGGRAWPKTHDGRRSHHEIWGRFFLAHPQLQGLIHQDYNVV